LSGDDRPDDFWPTLHHALELLLALALVLMLQAI
jgi:hypothetical protein